MVVAQVILPTGVRRNGTRHRGARLTWPDEAGERDLVEASRDLLPAEQVSRLVARCVEIEGESGDPLALELTAGDRVALVLQLRRLACGEALECLVTCSNPDCAQQLELDLRVADLLEDPDAASLERTVQESGVVFRLPTGADEEKAARRATSDFAAAVDELLADCVVAGDVGLVGDIRASVIAAMAAADPQAELIIDLSCPDCGAVQAVAFDPAGFLFTELERRVEMLEREIHGLASGYGWSEEQILALPKARRQRYLMRIQTGAA